MSTAPNLYDAGEKSSLCRGPIDSGAEAVHINGLPSVVTAFIVFAAITAANTVHYVASRMLFPLARESGSWFGYFGITDGTRQVPLRDLFASAIVVLWVPSVIFNAKMESMW